MVSCSGIGSGLCTRKGRAQVYLRVFSGLVVAASFVLGSAGHLSKEEGVEVVRVRRTEVHAVWQVGKAVGEGARRTVVWRQQVLA